MSENKVLISKSILTGVAATIREREGSSALIKPVDFASHIASMSIGQQGAPVSSITITNKDKLKSVRPGFSAEIDVEITPPWEGWTFSCVSSNPAVISVSSVLNANGKYEVTGVAESADPVTISVVAGDCTDSVEMKCRDLFEPDLSQAPDAEQLANIKNIIAAGVASEYLSTGQNILVPFGSYTLPLGITGFNPVINHTSAGDKTVPAINLLGELTCDGTTAWGANGSTKYSASQLRTFITTTCQNKFDPAILACLANTKVQTYSRDGSTDVVYDKLFAPSMAELGVASATYNTAQQAAVEGPAFTAYQGAADAKRIRNAVDAAGTAQYYWTRSLYSGNSSNFGFVFTSGAPSGGIYSNTRRVVVACNLIAESEA